MRVLASIFSVLLGSVYILELLSITEYRIIVLFFIAFLVLAIYETFSVIVLSSTFNALFTKKIKQFFIFLPFALFLYSISFVLTAKGSELLANKYLNQNKKEIVNIEQNIYMSKIDKLQSNIDSLNMFIPKFKSARDLQQVKILSNQKQIVFWQKEFAEQSKINIKNAENLQQQNTAIATNYYLIASVIMLLIFMINFYIVFLQKDEFKTKIKKITTQNSSNSKNKNDEIFLKILHLKKLDYSQREIASMLNIGESTISRIIKKNNEKTAK